jgi:hypothetical protein
MKKLLTPIVLLFVLSACEKPEYFEPTVNYELTIDSVLTRDGKRSLPKDSNGYYILELQQRQLNPRSADQQTHRITGRILVNGKQPNPALKISWESNLYWYLKQGDTVAALVKSYINYYTGQFTIVQLPPLISNKDELVTTINPASYSGTNGEINTMIAPIMNMKGDTMIVKASNWESKKTIYTKIILR